MKKIRNIWKSFVKTSNQQTVSQPSLEPKQKETKLGKATAERKKDETKQKKTEPELKSNKKENKMENETNGKMDRRENSGKARIYNLIIVDESGSMGSLREATLSGINETIGTIRSAQEEFASTQTHTLTLVTFDSGSNRPDVRTVIDNEPISKVGKFKDYMPSGCTPLYDAMGQSLTTLHNRIKDDSDATAVVTVLTDGLENDSHEWTGGRLQKLIEKLKALGWSFSYMGSAHDVKEVTTLLSIENVVEFSHDVRGAENTWQRERSSRRAYYEKMSEMYSEERAVSKEERLERKRRYAREYYGPRVTPNRTDHLEEGEIFVFGSDAAGHHGGGAAKYAVRKFGAIWGQGEGLQGRSYGIPTMGGMEEISQAVVRFTKFAAEHPEKCFLVTRIACGVAGYSANDIAPLFRDCIRLENVALPSDFWEVLGLKMEM